MRARLASGYWPLYDDRPDPPGRPRVPATWLETDTADGSIASTPADMARYLRLLLNRGQGPHGRLLTDESFALLVNRVIPTQENRYYGYGLTIWEMDGHTLASHGGTMPGFRASMAADLDAGFGVVVLANAPGDTHLVADYALRLLRAEQAGEDLPDLPPAQDATYVPDAAAYAGTYTDGERTLNLQADGEHLVLRHDGTSIVLGRRDPDQFYVDHPAYSRFLLRFGRDGNTVVEAFHGSAWYRHDRYSGPTAFDYPAEWTAYPGHYRSHNPWLPAFRVVLRKGALALIDPAGSEEPLVPLGRDTFRVGLDDRGPERLRFDQIVDGQALRATTAMCDYYRFFTP
jgi:hypothetical protein